ncbi:unnamed protein product [Oncorhynchus mykiss]|uniref:Uncharacterized protein n=1 Tax=Oncorhynchus mykiss TaxID=8022 RepID=A0A060WKN7_ONCMY|nr:unnamed protein product [Oncorhynchus mykiss]
MTLILSPSFFHTLSLSRSPSSLPCSFQPEAVPTWSCVRSSSYRRGLPRVWQRSVPVAGVPNPAPAQPRPPAPPPQPHTVHIAAPPCPPLPPPLPPPPDKTPTPTKCQSCPDHDHTTPGHEGAVSGSKLKRPTFHSSRGSLTGENGGATPTSTKPGRTDPRRTPSGASGAASRAGSRAGSRASSRRGSDASDASELLETRSACSDTSDTPRRPGAAKPSKIPTISKKAPSPKTPASGKK